MPRWLKLSAVLPGVLALAAAGVCQSPAAPAEYGTKDLSFTLDIPAGWQIERRTGGVDFYPPDGKAFASVLAHPRGAKNVDAVARSLCQAMQARTCERSRSGAWLIVSERKGTKLFTTLHSFGRHLLLTSYAGDSRRVQPVLKTLKVRR